MKTEDQNKISFIRKLKPILNILNRDLSFSKTNTKVSSKISGIVFIYKKQKYVFGGEAPLSLFKVTEKNKEEIFNKLFDLPLGYNFDHVPVRALEVVEFENHFGLLYIGEKNGGKGVGIAFCKKGSELEFEWRGNGFILTIGEFVAENFKKVSLRGKDGLTFFFQDGNKFKEKALEKVYAYEGVTDLQRVVERSKNNPMISPREEYSWENVATLNPGAVLHNGIVHIFYRAIGGNGVSTIGYAQSVDGETISKRLPYPVYVAGREPGVLSRENINRASPAGYATWGAEDPRVTIFGDRLYIMYAAYNGWHDARAAYTSISLKDFENENWNFTAQEFMSPPTDGPSGGAGNKSICLLPEKIDGKYVVFHRMWPNICIDYIDELSFGERVKWLHGQKVITPRPGFWDSGKLGIGAVPIKTSDGWLVIYQGVGPQKNQRGYIMGAMLLDLHDPSKVIARGIFPILKSEKDYEVNGLTGHVIYPCGAVIKDDTLFIYYGGADKYVCTAKAPVKEFLENLKKEIC